MMFGQRPQHIEEEDDVRCSLPPTQTMYVILTKLAESGGRMLPRPFSKMGAYEIVGYRWPTWFPRWAAQGIIDRGLVDSRREINSRGRAALRNRP